VTIDATIRVPGSKSLTNRALLCAALASGESTIRGALRADDTDAMAGCVASLGARLTWDGDDVRVFGRGLASGSVTLDARQSGTTSRFLLPVLATGAGSYRLDGDGQLRKRPLADLIAAVRALGAEVREDGDVGHLPVTVSGGPVSGGAIEIAGDVTSQFLSGLLLAGPNTGQGIEVVPTSALVGRPYLELTADVMRVFGATVDGLRAAPGGYQPATYVVEPDASAASYFFAAAAIRGGRVTVERLGAGSHQGDVGFVDVLAAMGASVERSRDAITVSRPGALHGIDADLADMPDMALTLAVVAVFADSPTRITGVGFTRGHESDRIEAAVTELRRCGIAAEATDDGFTVQPGEPHAARITTYGDHRVAMAFALLGLEVDGIELDDPGCVAKTFPGYFETLGQLQ
jgi:3-phosphoshikimate 1-carboxyvinyltransferase